MKVIADSAISEITWRQPVTEASYGNEREPTLTLGFGNAGAGTWITIKADGFAFDSADDILNLAVIAEDLLEKHEKAGVFG